MHDVLALTENCQNWRSNVKYAAQITALVDGMLTGLYIELPPVPLPEIASGALYTELAELVTEQTQMAYRAAPAFKRWAGACGVRRCDWHVAKGPLRSVLGYGAGWYDVLVLGRGPETPWDSAGELGRILLTVDVPCIVVPADFGMDARLNTVAVAWKGTPESVRALHAAMPLLRRAQHIVLIRGKDPQVLPMNNWIPPIDAEQYLADHGLRITAISIDAAGDEAGQVLLAAAAKVSADLLVMGAYGRSRFSEWFFGGVTKHVLEHGRIPLFMRS